MAFSILAMGKREIRDERQPVEFIRILEDLDRKFGRFNVTHRFNARKPRERVVIGAMARAM